MMELFGNIVIYLIMACAFAGCVASIAREDHPLGQEFLAGLNAIGMIFLPVAGIMAAAPFITMFVTRFVSPFFASIGADPSIAATSIIAVDMGGYQLAKALAQSHESWMMAMCTGFMAGASIVFSIPVALKMLQAKDRPYLALGVMSGFIALPFGVLVSSLLLFLLEPSIRDTVMTAGASTYTIHLDLATMTANLLPLTAICALIAVGLYAIPSKMITGFIIFGRIMDACLRLVVVMCIIEYFTGIFGTIWGSWGFDPIIADARDYNRALEVSGYIGIMLCGAFPLVYMIKTYLARPLGLIGSKVGLSSDATTGILAASANVLALFAIVDKMRATDKIKCIAFSVCCAFLFGDHLAFCANFQPNMILPVMGGKLAGGVLAVWIAGRFVAPMAERIERDKPMV